MKLKNPTKLLRLDLVLLKELVDAATTSESKTVVRARGKSLQTSSELVFITENIDVTASRASSNLLGTVQATLTVPASVSYALDLKKLRYESCHFDAKSKRLTVVLCPIKVTAIEPDLASQTTQASYTGWRVAALNDDTVAELELAILKGDFQAKAKELAEERISTLRPAAKDALRQIMRPLLRNLDAELMLVITD